MRRRAAEARLCACVDGAMSLQHIESIERHIGEVLQLDAEGGRKSRRLADSQRHDLERRLRDLEQMQDRNRRRLIGRVDFL